MKKGLLVAFEGLDRTGKTTQSKLLLANLLSLNLKAKLIHFPVRTSATGRILDQYLKKQIDLNSQASHLLFSANRW